MKEFDSTKHTRYFITDKGEVYTETSYYNTEGLRKRKLHLAKRGYLHIRTPKKNHPIHRLVAKYYIPNPENKPCVNHKDGNKLNNHVRNLEWATHLENTRHAIENNLIKPTHKNSGPLKYSNETCRAVLDLVNKGMTYKKAGEKHNMPYSTVAHLVRGSRRQVQESPPKPTGLDER